MWTRTRDHSHARRVFPKTAKAHQTEPALPIQGCWVLFCFFNFNTHIITIVTLCYCVRNEVLIEVHGGAGGMVAAAGIGAVPPAGWVGWRETLGWPLNPARGPALGCWAAGRLGGWLDWDRLGTGRAPAGRPNPAGTALQVAAQPVDCAAWRCQRFI